MINVGIDSLCIDSSRYALSLETLAQARGIDPSKYRQGLGQWCMAVPPPGEDIVTMAANAAKVVLQDYDINDFEMLLFATESGIDQSKAAGIYVHHLLGLPESCRVLELKQACYSATAGLQLAIPYLQMHPDKKVLLIASDVARYGLGTTGESSQGAGAIAIVLAANPRILTIEPEYGIATQHAMDFWRPNYLHEALVEGKYSSKLYLTMLEKTFSQYQQKSKRALQEHAYICYHSPVPRLVEKAHQQLTKAHSHESKESTTLLAEVEPTLIYSRQIGNSYTAALYVCLASLLDHAPDLTGKRIGFYSYGSGCMAEFFSGKVKAGYQKALHTHYQQNLLAKRQMLNYQQYAEFYSYPYTQEGDIQIIPEYDTGSFRLSKLENHQRIYTPSAQIKVFPQVKASIPETKTFKVIAPGKLILSGEHSVVYGQPALAIAINRYVTATVTPARDQQIGFDFSNLAHRGELTLAALHALKQRIKQKYHRFIQGDFSIRKVLTKPFELAQYALGVISEALNVASAPGMHIKVESDLPIGCGLGSSAATIVSVMHALTTYLDAPLSKDAFYQLALDVENMQHGKSSGIDLQVAMQGGCLLVENNHIQSRAIPTLPLYLVNTGTPSVSTGQCVEHVAPLFKKGTLAQEFGMVTRALDTALTQHSFQDASTIIRENHRLLADIGVVPDKVKAFISEVEHLNGAAKICGAGSVSGDNAGAVLIMLEDATLLPNLCARYQYHSLPIACEARGVHAA